MMTKKTNTLEMFAHGLQLLTLNTPCACTAGKELPSFDMTVSTLFERAESRHENVK